MVMRGVIVVATGCLILWTNNKVQGNSFPNLFSAPYPAVSSPKLIFNQDMPLPLMRPYHPWGNPNYGQNSFHASPFNWPLPWMNQPNYNRFRMPPIFPPFGQNMFPPMPMLPFSIFEPQTYIENNPRIYDGRPIPSAASKEIILDAPLDESIDSQQKTGAITPTDNHPLPNTEIPVNEHPQITTAAPTNSPQTTASPTKDQAQTTPATEQPKTTIAAPIEDPQTTVSPINDQGQTTPANEQPQSTAAEPINNPQTTIPPTNHEAQTTPENEQPQTTAAALKNSPQTTVSPTNDQAQTTVAAPTNNQPGSNPEISTNDQPQSTAAASVSDQPQQSQTDNAIIVSDKSEVALAISPSTEYPQQEAVSSADTGSTEILASASSSPPQGDESSDSITTKSSISIFIPSENGRNKVRAVLIGPGSFSGSSGSSGSSISGNGNIAILDPETLQRDISSPFTALKPPQINPIMIPSQAGIPSFPNLSGGSSASNGAGNMGFPHFIAPSVQFQQNDKRIPEDSQPPVVFPGFMKDNILNSNFQNPFL